MCIQEHRRPKRHPIRKGDLIEFKHNGEYLRGIITSTYRTSTTLKIDHFKARGIVVHKRDIRRIVEKQKVSLGTLTLINGEEV